MVRLADHHSMTIAADWNINPHTKQKSSGFKVFARIIRRRHKQVHKRINLESTNQVCFGRQLGGVSLNLRGKQGLIFHVNLMI